MPSRRALLAAAGASLAAGCAYEMPTPTPTPSPTATEEPTPTEPPVCDEVTVSELDFRAATPGTDDGPDEEYVVAVVESEAADPPALVGRIVGCDGPEEVRRELDGEGTYTFEFGPYEVGCVTSVDLGFEGCNG
ncbi:hypothetical protein [Halosegnis marinus]|uniref:Lipoprotein n=1 Tax=Halosegnis marinus TaxID=3034023 RepID=A0ABD5ZTA1_9EURY|nr:hypothetical protein [Halosegnis sp. DT85]